MKTGNILWRVVLLAICVIMSILACNIYGTTDSGGGGAEYFIVSFDSRGGSSVLEQEILSGERSLEPVDMQNGELVFSGWYQEETCDNCWNFDDPVTETRTFYAKWSPADSLTFTLIHSDTQYEVSMGSDAFDADLYIPAYYQGIPVTQIAGWAFYQCNSLTEVRLSSGVVNIGDCAFTLSSLQSISLPASLQVIGASAFSSSSLTYVEIPAGVTSISARAFSACTAMDEISINPDNENYTTIDGVLFTKDLSYLHTYPIGKSGSAYTIPSTVTEIGYGAFQSSSIEDVTVPSSVITIYDNGFAECSALNNINIPSSVTSLGTRAFAYSFRDTASTIFIPASVSSVGLQEFWGCSNLSIYCEAPVKPDGWADSWNQDNRPVFWNQTSAP